MDSRQRQFEALVQAYSADLFRFALWMCHHTELAEDLVQETFMRAWKSLDSLQDYTAAKSWLLTILRREMARHYRRQKPNTISLEELVQEPATAAVDQVEVFVLRQGLRKLAAKYREPLLLQVIGGFSCDEIARIMNLQPGAVMTRLFRARQQMRAQLEEPQPMIRKR